MHVIYLITHKERFKNNIPPYYYIGSKYNWKGDGTYYGSSTHPIMKKSKPEDLSFEILFWFDECTHKYLTDVEKRVQQNLNCVHSLEYFNMAYASCSRLGDEEKELQRRNAFSKYANSLNEDGVKYSVVWATKSKTSLDIPTSNGQTRRQILSESKRERMNSLTDDGMTVAQKIQQKTIATNMEIGEDGLTGYQRQGIKLSEWLNDIDSVTGLKNSEIRVLKNPNTKRVEVLGMCFYSKSEACRFLGIGKVALDNILKGEATSITYNVLLKILDKDYLDIYFKKKPLFNCDKVIICGNTYNSKREARVALNAPKSSFEKFVKTGIPNKAIRKLLIEYFGEEIFLKHFRENSVLA